MQFFEVIPLEMYTAVWWLIIASQITLIIFRASKWLPYRSNTPTVTHCPIVTDTQWMHMLLSKLTLCQLQLLQQLILIPVYPANFSRF